ncbi:unnamed protein product [Closterium sp. NIES-54]
MLHNVSDSFTLQWMMIQEQRYHDLITKANHDQRPPRMAGQARGDRSPSPTAKGNSGKKEGSAGEKTHGKDGDASRSSLVCWYCKEPGHPFFKCTKAPLGWNHQGGNRIPAERQNNTPATAVRSLHEGVAAPSVTKIVSKQQGASEGDNKHTVTCIAMVRSSQAVLPPAGASLWMVDSECSQHMTSDTCWFEELHELGEPVYVELADGSHMSSTIMGTIRATAPDGTTVRYTEVLYVPGLKSNLLSYCQLLKRGAHINTIADGDTEITMPDGDECVRIGLGKNMDGVLMVEYELALTSAHDPGYSHDDASSKKHGREGGTPLCTPGVHLDTHMSTLFRTLGIHLCTDSAYRMAHQACVVWNPTHVFDTDIHSSLRICCRTLDCA